MTKEQYLLIKEKPEIPMDIWYDFFLERGGSNIGLSKFTEAFTNVLLGVNIIKPSGIKHVSLKTSLDKFYKYYNHKFSV